MISILWARRPPHPSFTCCAWKSRENKPRRKCSAWEASREGIIQEALKCWGRLCWRMPGEAAALCMQITPVSFCHRLPASKNVSCHRHLSPVAISPELPALFPTAAISAAPFFWKVFLNRYHSRKYPSAIWQSVWMPSPDLRSTPSRGACYELDNLARRPKQTRPAIPI